MRRTKAELERALDQMDAALRNANRLVREARRDNDRLIAAIADLSLRVAILERSRDACAVADIDRSITLGQPPTMRQVANLFPYLPPGEYDIVPRTGSGGARGFYNGKGDWVGPGGRELPNGRRVKA